MNKIRHYFLYKDFIEVRKIKFIKKSYYEFISLGFLSSYSKMNWSIPANTDYIAVTCIPSLQRKRDILVLHICAGTSLTDFCLIFLRNQKLRILKFLIQSLFRWAIRLDIFLFITEQMSISCFMTICLFVDWISEKIFVTSFSATINFMSCSNNEEIYVWKFRLIHIRQEVLLIK